MVSFGKTGSVTAPVHSGCTRLSSPACLDPLLVGECPEAGPGLLSVCQTSRNFLLCMRELEDFNQIQHRKLSVLMGTETCFWVLLFQLHLFDDYSTNNYQKGYQSLK